MVPRAGCGGMDETDRGKVRKNNEDSFLALQFDGEGVRYLGKVGEASTSSTDFVFAVSDGMGGAASGEYASRITVEKITRILPKSFKQSAVGIEAGFTDVLAEIFDQVHRTLTYVGGSYEECFGMGATLSLCWFTPSWMYFGHIGDSRIYYLPATGEGIKQLSHDDTHVGWLLRNGKINAREARYHPRRTVLQKALGAGHQFVDPQIGSVSYASGDMFMLCTDGLVEGLFDEQFMDVLRSAPPVANPAERLVSTSVEAAGRDNTTALVIQIL